MLVRRIPLENVPEDEEKAAAWLQNLFIEKDKIIDSFHNTGSFFKTSGIKETAYIDYPKRLSTMINFAVWALFSISLVMYYLISSLVLQNWIGLSIAVGILLTCKFIIIQERIFQWILMLILFHFITVYIFMVKSINMSKISKGSSYGADAKAAGK